MVKITNPNHKVQLLAMFWTILFCSVILMCICDGKKKNYLDEKDFTRARHIPNKPNGGTRELMENPGGDTMVRESDAVEEEVEKINESKEKLSESHQEKSNKKERRTKRVKRSADVNTKLWPKVNDYVRIPYEISSVYSDEERAIIAGAIADFESCTCIRFVRKKTSDNNYVVIEEHSDWGCGSYNGMHGGNQTLALTRGPPDDTCVFHTRVQHELMHVLGFFHEHSRTDRDQYVTINWDNVKPEQKKNFKKYENQMDLGTKYDYNSVMHYDSMMFSKNRKPTLVAKQPGGEYLGESAGFTRTDITDINRLYNCSIADTEGCAKEPCVDWYPDCIYKYDCIDEKSKGHCKRTCNVCDW